MSQSSASRLPAAKPAADELTLLVINGSQTGARTEIARGSRYLIGAPLDSDFVLDTGDAVSQCLLSWIDDDAQLTPLRGQVAIGPRVLPTNVTVAAPLREAITVGRTSFALGRPTDSLDQVTPPARISAVADEAVNEPIPHAPAPLAATRALGHAGRLAVLFAGVLVVASLILVAKAGIDERLVATAFARVSEELAGSIKQRSETELVLQRDAELRRITLSGFYTDPALPDEFKREAANAGVELLWFARHLPTTREALARQLAAGGLVAQPRYEGDGAFLIDLTSRELPTLRRVGLGLFRDVSGLRSLRIAVSDVTRVDTGEPVFISITVPSSRPDRIDVNAPEAPYTDVMVGGFKVMRTDVGTVRSVVTQKGMRLFEGARLPDGSELARVERDHVVIVRGGAQRREPIEGATL